MLIELGLVCSTPARAIHCLLACGIDERKTWPLKLVNQHLNFVGNTHKSEVRSCSCPPQVSVVHSLVHLSEDAALASVV